jgi:pimeloyl-ACP methyl ester carboxylesterase
MSGRREWMEANVPRAFAASSIVVMLLVAGIAPAASAARRTPVSRAVTFTVQNLNRSQLACPSDGATYQVRGHLTAPGSVRSSRRRKPAATLYLHGLGFGEWFWTFGGQPPAAPGQPAAPKGYNYATEQAKAGHTSVTIDRLGYDTSGHPVGTQTCMGSQADIAHQIVQQLRAGSYSVTGGKATHFKKVALAGHSAGGEIAMLEAYSFKDVDALIDVSFSYSNLPRAQLAFGPTRDKCVVGGEPAEPGQPSGYAYFGQTPADFQSLMFHSASRSVVDAAMPLRNRDPCGETGSIITGLLLQKQGVPKITVPVLVICGTKDALYSSLGCSQQRDQFRRSRRASLELVRGAGHAVTLERQARKFRAKVGRWLKKRGY